MAYVPVGNVTTSSGLAHLQSTYYSKKGLDRAQATFRFKEPCFSDMVPKRVGRTCQWFRYDNLAASTQQSREGTVGTSLTFNSHVVGADLAYYSAFISLSSYLNDTAIDPITENASDLLGYQAGLSNDTITRGMIDEFSSSTDTSLQSTYPTAEDLRAGVARLQGRNFLPFDDGNFLVVLHPYTWFDIINDPAANGYADIFKYTTTNTAMKNNADVRKKTLDTFAGVRIMATTNVKVTAGAPNTYRMYMFAKNGIGYSSLEGWTPSDVSDPNTQKFKINVLRGGSPTLFDPTGEIGSVVSYRYTFVTVVVSGPSGIGGDFRYLTFECPTQLGL